MRTAAAVLALTLVVGACGGGEKKEASDEKAASTTSTAFLDPTQIDPATTAATARGSVTTVKPGSTPRPTGPAAPAGEPNVVAVAPGNYKYTGKGTSSAKGTVNGAPIDTSKKVEKAWEVRYLPSTGRIQKANYAGQADILEQDLSYGDGFASITFLRLNNGGGETVFTPNPAARYVPMPATIGATWSWTMVSKPDKNGKATTRKGTFRADRTDVLMIDGKAVPVVVITGTVTADQPIARTYQYTTYYSEAHKLIAKEREIWDGDVKHGDNTDIHLHSDVTTTITSLNPAA